MNTRYTPRTASELAADLAKPDHIVVFVARRGAVDRMPKTPEDARRPGYKTPLTSGMVVGMSGGRAQVEDSLGHGGSIAVEDALYRLDPL